MARAFSHLIPYLLLGILTFVHKSDAASNDNNVEWNGVFSDQNLRIPQTPAKEQSFKVELRVLRSDITAARVRTWDGSEKHYSMRWVRNERSIYDIWQATLRAPRNDYLYYRFEITDGNDTDHYNRLGMSDDVPARGDFLIDLTEFGSYRLGPSPEKDGTVFRVWAPNAEKVSVAGDFNQWNPNSDLLKANAGIWQGRVPKAKHGDEYRYVITNKGTHWRTDPYARKMTSSIGNSIIWDPDTFEWTDQEWVTPHFEDMILYELHIGTFSGEGDGATNHPATFRDAVDQHLDHLVELGINTVELMPVTEFSGDLSWGYNPMSQFAIESSYGDPNELKYFVNRCHNAEIAVIVDTVYNHMGGNDLADNLLNYDGSEIYFYPEGNGFRKTPWGPRPDYGITEVREYLLDTVRYWINEYHMDGFRIDATSYIKVNSDGWQLLKDIKDVTDTVSLKAFVSAEQLPNDPAITVPTEAGGAGLDSQWNDLFHDHLREALNATSFGDPNMGKLVQGMNHFDFGGTLAINYIESHDEAANHGRVVKVADNSNPHSEYAYGRGKLCYGLVMFTSGIPMILQGQEMMEDRNFGDSKDKKIQWQYKTKYEDYFLACRDMTWIRRTAPALRSNANQNIFHVNESDNVIAWHRWTGNGDDVVIIANFNNNHFDNYCIGMPRDGKWIETFNSDSSIYGGNNFGNEGTVTANGNSRDGLPSSACIELPRMGIVVLSKSPISFPVNFDADNDGMDDAWERRHGLDPNQYADAAMDPDHDGMNSLQEYQAGTDPHDPESRFKITRLSMNQMGRPAIHWDSVQNRTYRILSSPTLKSGSYTEIGTIEGTGDPLTFIDKRNQKERQTFYLLEVSTK
ncbi:alpha-amylase family glycosyl hydrolase [Verrucomicrobiales bacterium]|nr:alpha-amylase family glycosyl hydrolase [Verrucomicrobiales bacterium]